MLPTCARVEEDGAATDDHPEYIINTSSLSFSNAHHNLIYRPLTALIMAHLTASGRKKVAIVGSGAAGIGALWALNRTHHDVYVYEANSRLGGHTHTVDFVKGRFKAAVDTGFIMLNSATSPNFLEFLRILRVQTVPVDMSCGVLGVYGFVMWLVTLLSAVFSQGRELFSPRVWRILFDIIRFNQFALDLLRDEEERQVYGNGYGHGDQNGHSVLNRHAPQSSYSQLTIGEYLDREDYSDAFRDDYLIPMTAAVWSTNPDHRSLEIPAATLVRFMWNHSLLSTLSARSSWLTIKNGSKSYIDAVMNGFPPNHLLLNSPVTAVANISHGKVQVQLQNGRTHIYDHVILATHGDTALKLISSTATAVEKSILSNFQTSQTTVILHSDVSLLPKKHLAWPASKSKTISSLASSQTIVRTGPANQACITFNMNNLQNIPASTFGAVLLTLNPTRLPPQELVQGRYTYRHALYTPAAARSQALLPRIQNKRGISYCGAWTRYGFHEDAFTSGIKVAVEHLGAKLPFEVCDSPCSRQRLPVLGVWDWLLRVVVLVVQIGIVVVGEALRVGGRRKRVGAGGQRGRGLLAGVF